jgi:hypothetical protein
VAVRLTAERARAACRAASAIFLEVFDQQHWICHSLPFQTNFASIGILTGILRCVKKVQISRQSLFSF